MHRSLLSRLSYATAPTYIYRFAFDSPTFNHYRKKQTNGEILTGVAHADDLSYIWYGDHSWKLDKCSPEYKTIERMVNLFIDFASNRDYNYQFVYDDECKRYPFIWWPLKSTDPYLALNIGETMQIIEIPEKKDLQIWDSMYVHVKDQLY